VPAVGWPTVGTTLLPEIPMEITERTWRLLLEKVDSFEKLEALALTSGGATSWTAREAAQKLGLPEELVLSALLDLAAVSILDKVGDRFTYNPRTPELAADSAALAAAYRDDRIRVLNLVTSAALERIRSSAAHLFASAFRVKPDKKDPKE
jgi:hypothetical protein